jgi:hypothetical protein
VTATNAYEELSRQRLDAGRGYDKRSVETFRAHALDLVDTLLRQVSELEDRLAAGGQAAMSEAESDLLRAFRFADSLQRHEALTALERLSDLTQSPSVDEHDSAAEHDDWLPSLDGSVAAPPAVVNVDLRVPAPDTAPRVPLRVAGIDSSSRPPTPPTPWGGWVE